MFVEASKSISIDRYAKCYTLYVIDPSTLNENTIAPYLLRYF